MFLSVLEVKNKSRTAAQTKFGAINHENQENYWAECQNWFIFTRLSCSKPCKMLLLEKKRALFTFAGLSRFCFSFSKNENSILAEKPKQAAKRGFGVSLWWIRRNSESCLWNSASSRNFVVWIGRNPERKRQTWGVALIVLTDGRRAKLLLSQCHYNRQSVWENKRFLRGFDLKNNQPQRHKVNLMPFVLVKIWTAAFFFFLFLPDSKW